MSKRDGSFWTRVKGENEDMEEIKQGWKELTFDLPLKANRAKNFRWDYIKNDYLVRVREDDKEDWYLIKTPKKSKSGGITTNSVRCVHVSTNLKTKNLLILEGCHVSFIVLYPWRKQSSILEKSLMV